ncbi:MAG: hypothetical protein N2036_05635, partial [Bryobacteraceae bacterium]|nr:hypothetical protein [Bryobacteraceae bacterium]
MQNCSRSSVPAALAGACIFFAGLLSAQPFVSPAPANRPGPGDEILDRALDLSRPAPPSTLRPPNLLGSRDPLEDLAAPAQKAFRQAEKLFLHGKFLIQEGK